MTPAAQRAPIGFAHRGARRECRDNTLASFARALDLGARALETDAWVTVDGVAVLDHDGLVWRGMRRRPLRTAPRAALPGHIPSLQDLYDRCGTAFELSIDIKDPDVAAPVLEVARRAGAVSRLWLCSPDIDALRRWRSLNEDAHLVHSTGLRALRGASGAGEPLAAASDADPARLVGSGAGPDPLGATEAGRALLGTDGARIGHQRSPEEADRLLTDHARRLHKDGIGALNLHQESWTRAGVEAVQSEGIIAFAWDAQTETALRRLISLGVGAVYSDDVKVMVTVIAEAGGR